jgi:hypothetical protein
MARMSKHASDQSLGKSSSLNESTQINNANTILNLQKAFGDEFNTVYQYFIQANILEYSQNYNSIVKELKQHGMEEYHHAKLIANRIKELGGKVDPNPLKALQINTCGYIEPHNPDSYDIVNKRDGARYIPIPYTNREYTNMTDWLITVRCYGLDFESLIHLPL